MNIAERNDTEKRIYDPVIEEQAREFPRFDVSDAEGTRAVVAELNEAAAADGFVRLTDNRVEEIERKIPGCNDANEIPIRIYMPKSRSGAGAGFVNFHGGGFIMGDLESEHDRCLMMAAEGGAVSIGVDYRLAPEFPFPAGADDCCGLALFNVQGYIVQDEVIAKLFCKVLDSNDCFFVVFNRVLFFVIHITAIIIPDF